MNVADLRRATADMDGRARVYVVVNQEDEDEPGRTYRADPFVLAANVGSTGGVKAAEQASDAAALVLYISPEGELQTGVNAITGRCVQHEFMDDPNTEANYRVQLVAAAITEVVDDDAGLKASTEDFVRAAVEALPGEWTDHYVELVAYKVDNERQLGTYDRTVEEFATNLVNDLYGTVS